MAVMLDRKGLALSAIMGVLTFFFGGERYLALLLAFLFLSVWVTRYGEEEKRERGIYEYERGWENVLSNGIIPTALGIASPFIGPMPFITSVAAVTSDKFASELGVLGKRKPIFLLTLKEARAGTSGAISGMGTAMSFIGALAIGTAAIVLFGIKPSTAIFVALGGFAGSMADTLAGVLEERGIGNKSTSNLICAIAGGLCGAFIPSA